MQFTEGINTLENYIAGYWWAFGIYQKQVPEGDELEYIEFIALPQALKSYNATGTQPYILQAKVQRGKFVKWIAQRQLELQKAPKAKPKTKTKALKGDKPGKIKRDKREPAQANTRQRFIKYNAYYLQQYEQLKSYTLAVKATTRHFHITERTLERAWAYAAYLKEK